MEKRFLDLAREGKNDWWRYALSGLVILVGWFGSGVVISLFLLAIVTLDGQPDTFVDLSSGRIVGLDAALTLALSLLSGAALIASLVVAVRAIHQRPVRSLVTPRPRLDWKRLLTGFASFAALAALSCLVEALLFPGRYRWSWDVQAFLRFLPVVLILLPIQTTAEELLFRGYLMQSLGLVARRPIVPVVVSSLVFMLLHLANPEVSAHVILVPAYYFAVGLLLALVALRDDRLELTIGAHAGTVLFTALFVNYTGSVVPTPSVYTVTELDAVYNLVSFIVIALVFYAGVFLFGAAVRPGGEGKGQGDMRGAPGRRTAPHHGGQDAVQTRQSETIPNHEVRRPPTFFPLFSELRCPCGRLGTDAEPFPAVSSSASGDREAGSRTTLTNAQKPAKLWGGV